MGCKGIIGKIFGHKFVDGVGNTIRNKDGIECCFRCGIPAGKGEKA